MPDELMNYTSGADQPFFEALAQGDLTIPKCKGCGRWQWPAVFRCSECGSWESEWEKVAPAGHVYAWTRTWHTFAGAEAFQPPYLSVVVELAEAPGVRLLGALKDTGEAFGIGSRVTGRPSSVASAAGPVPAMAWTLAGE